MRNSLKRSKSLTKASTQPARKPKTESKPKSKVTAPPKPSKRLPADLSDPRARALELMKKGLSQREAARAQRISVKALASYRKRHTKSKWKGNAWVITDTRPVMMLIASKGKRFSVAVPYRSTSTVARYWNAVNMFLDTNRIAHLKPFAGSGIRDADKKFHPWETDPNTLRKLDSIGELSFAEIYADTVR